MSDTFTVAAFAGSLRTRSYNRALLHAAAEHAPERLTIDPIIDLSNVPLYNGDLEAEGDPESVAALKDALHDADGLLIVSPEYNASIPAVTKNAIDWASRPPKPTALNDLPVAIAGTTPGALGTARMQGHLRSSLANTNARVMPQPQFYLGKASERFNDNLELTDESTIRFLQHFLNGFADWIEVTGA